MTPETLETLLMDDALGATSPELHMLLEAYLEKDPAACLQLDHWQKLTSSARAAMPPAASVTLPQFPRQRLRTLQRTAVIGRIVAATGLAAACLLLGFTWGTRQKRIASPAPSVVQLTSAKISAEPLSQVAQVNDIWSMDRLQSAALKKESQRPAARPATLLQQLHLGDHL